MVRVAVPWLGEISADTGGRTYFQELLEPLGAVPGLEVDVHIADSAFHVPETCSVVRHRVRAGSGATARVAAEQILAWRLSREDYDVLLAPFNVIPWTWRAPAVVVQHNVLAGEGATRESGLLRQWYRRRAVASSVHRATHVIAVSHYLRQLLLSWYPDLDPLKVSVIPLAPSTSLLSPSTGLAPREGDINVLVVAALWRYKGVEDAVEAFAAVAGGRSSIRLEIAGPGTPSARARISRLAEDLGVGRQVHLLGHLSHAELAGRYKSASVLLFLSTIESFGLPVLEAMALGVPVVARRIEAVSETAGDAAIWVEVDAPTSEIAVVLRDVLENDTLRKRAIRSGLTRSAQFTWTAVADATAEVLRKAVDAPRDAAGSARASPRGRPAAR